MGKRRIKRRSKNSTDNVNNSVASMDADYQVPVLPIHELMALNHSKLDAMHLRAVSVKVPLINAFYLQMTHPANVFRVAFTWYCFVGSVVRDFSVQQEYFKNTCL